MKSLVIAVMALLTVSLSSAQQGNANKIPEFKSNQFVGIVTYFIEDVIKESKVKDKKQIETVSTIITAYNLKVEELTLLNKDVMDISEITMNDKIQAFELTKDERAIRETIQKISETLAPIKIEVEGLTKKLDDDLKQVFKKKQFKKWLKFKKKRRLELNPEKDDMHRNHQPIQRSQSPFNKNNRASRMRGY